ncbi:MAG: hypothetical protein KA764_04720 [Anaerolineales bacterium]|nr:hypothetical protein [Anaerolineales bacterium]
MASNSYHFVTRWRLPGTCEEISQVLMEARALPRWWPAVYLDVAELAPGDSAGVGKVISLYTKGWLPYTLHWQFQVTANQYPYGFQLEAWGDLTGRGVWTLAPAGAEVEVTYDWKVSGDKALFRYFSFLLKPLFSANHVWAMRVGETSLRLELARRRARTAAERLQVPAPPGPTFRPLGLAGRAWPTIRSN